MPEDTDSYVTVTAANGVYMAALMKWHAEDGGEFRPLRLGRGRHHTKEDAEAEARVWAAAMEVEYR